MIQPYICQESIKPCIDIYKIIKRKLGKNIDGYIPQYEIAVVDRLARDASGSSCFRAQNTFAYVTLGPEDADEGVAANSAGTP